MKCDHKIFYIYNGVFLRLYKGYMICTLSNSLFLSVRLKLLMHVYYINVCNCVASLLENILIITAAHFIFYVLTCRSYTYINKSNTLISKPISEQLTIKLYTQYIHSICDVTDPSNRESSSE